MEALLQPGPTSFHNKIEFYRHATQDTFLFILPPVNRTAHTPDTVSSLCCTKWPPSVPAMLPLGVSNPCPPPGDIGAPQHSEHPKRGCEGPGGAKGERVYSDAKTRKLQREGAGTGNKWPQTQQLKTIHIISQCCGSEVLHGVYASSAQHLPQLKSKCWPGTLFWSLEPSSKLLPIIGSIQGFVAVRQRSLFSWLWARGGSQLEASLKSTPHGPLTTWQLISSKPTGDSPYSQLWRSLGSDHLIPFAI